VYVKIVIAATRQQRYAFPSLYGRDETRLRPTITEQYDAEMSTRTALETGTDLKGHEESNAECNIALKIAQEDDELMSVKIHRT
jgi:hypothetical protein